MEVDDVGGEGGGGEEEKGGCGKSGQGSFHRAFLLHPPHPVTRTTS